MRTLKASGCSIVVSSTSGSEVQATLAFGANVMFRGSAMKSAPSGEESKVILFVQQNCKYCMTYR